MLQCPTCGSSISEQADVCPECGHELRGAKAPEVVPILPAPQAVPSHPHSPPVPPSAPGASTPQAPAPIGGLACITIKRNGIAAERFPLGEQALIGRFDAETGPVGVDLGQLPEAIYVSRHHAEIQRDASGAWTIKDLGAANGTFVLPKGQSKFQRITGEQPIHDGDEFALGNARFEFRIS
jgi:FHA domain/zinc-ribbon domain